MAKVAKKVKQPARRSFAAPPALRALVAKRVNQAVDEKVGGLMLRVNDPHGLLPAVVDESAASMLGDDGSTGALGLVEVKLTAAEEKILNEPVKVEELSMKPTGQPYLSHAKYTRWFNRAFGRLGWSIVQKSKPMRSERGKSVTVAAYYMLYIHGKPVAWALGEAEYYADNAEQTYGDALEATVAYALRRCAKRLGVGLELWEKPFLDGFIATHCVKVRLEGQAKPAWRLKTSAPFWNEVGEATDRKPPSGSSGEVIDAPRTLPPSGTHAQSGAGITERQAKRMFAIAKSAGRAWKDVLEWLESMGYDRALEGGDILRRDYDAIVAAIEQPGNLVKLGRR